MSAPTEASIQTQINHACWALENLQKGLNENAEKFAGHYDDYLAVAEGDRSALTLSGWDAMRGHLAQIIDFGRGMIDGLLIDYGKLLGFPDTDPEAILQRLYIEFAERGTPMTVLERNFTYGSPAAAGGNTGDGLLHRLNVSKYNYNIEAQTADAKVARCLADEHTGAVEHEELFEIRGANAARDFVAAKEGSGLSDTLVALSAGASEAVLRNPSFGQFTLSAGTITDIAGWTKTTAWANFTEDQTNFYRGYNGEGTPTAMRFGANDKLTQNFNELGATFDPNTPYYCQIAWNRAVGSGDGTVTLRMGASSASVAMAAQTGWNILKIAIGQGNWLRQFNKENPTLEIELSSRTTGYVLIDDIVVAPYSFFDGSYYALVGGAAPFLVDDKFTWSDTEDGVSVLQKWLGRLYGFSFPNVASPSQVWTEPS